MFLRFNRRKKGKKVRKEGRKKGFGKKENIIILQKSVYPPWELPNNAMKIGWPICSVTVSQFICKKEGFNMWATNLLLRVILEIDLVKEKEKMRK